MNRIVARFLDGRTLKGLTNDFLPAKGTFHVSAATTGAPVGRPEEIRIADLKAVFFVRTFSGNALHRKTNLHPQGNVPGRRIQIVFKDGEVMLGTTQGYDSSRPGFFVVPYDRAGNNERCYVVASATAKVSLV